MLSPSTGSRATTNNNGASGHQSNQQPIYKEYRKRNYEHMKYNIFKADSGQMIDNPAPATEVPQNEPSPNVAQIENQIQQNVIPFQQQMPMDFSQSQQQVSLTISSIQDKNYEVMDDIQLMAEQVCNGPPINFDIARFKTDGVIYITMLHCQAQAFKTEIH